MGSIRSGRRRPALAMATMFCVTMMFLGVILPGKLVGGSVDYGDFPGQTVIYQHVEESSLDPVFPLFGPPKPNPISGNFLRFIPNNFESSSAGPGGADVTDGMLTTTIMLKDGVLGGISEIVIHEGGDHSLAALPDDAAALATAALQATIRVTEIDNMPIGFLLSDSDSGFLQFSTGLAPSFGFWDLEVAFDVKALLAEHELTGWATKVELVLDNTLGTLSQDGSFAFIKKKEFWIDTPTSHVPEPSVLSLLVISMVALGIGSQMRR